MRNSAPNIFGSAFRKALLTPSTFSCGTLAMDFLLNESNMEKYIRLWACLNKKIREEIVRRPLRRPALHAILNRKET